VSAARARSTAKRERQVARFLVVTGLSGAGKSHAIHALEDLGYFCVDNLPVPLIPIFADLVVASADIERAAVVVDVREGGQLSEFPRVYGVLRRRAELDVNLIFLEAEQAMLVRRFSESRRPHPLAPNRSVVEGEREERRRMLPIRKLADRIVDTSKLSVHELRRVVAGFAGGSVSPQPLMANLVSFGFRRGVPHDADLMFDVRFLDNPHFVPSLRPLSGLDVRVSRYVLRTAPAREFLKRTFGLIRFLTPHYIEEGKSYLTVAIGCTGGRHRSVAMTEALAKEMRKLKGLQIRVQHRDVFEGQKREG
jgi:UPF0042 nucleotide-binding protein